MNHFVATMLFTAVSQVRATIKMPQPSKIMYDHNPSTNTLSSNLANKLTLQAAGVGLITTKNKTAASLKSISV